MSKQHLFNTAVDETTGMSLDELLRAIHRVQQGNSLNSEQIKGILGSLSESLGGLSEGIDKTVVNSEDNSILIRELHSMVRRMHDEFTLKFETQNQRLTEIETTGQKNIALTDVVRQDVNAGRQENLSNFEKASEQVGAFRTSAEKHFAELKTALKNISSTIHEHCNIEITSVERFINTFFRCIWLWLKWLWNVSLEVKRFYMIIRTDLVTLITQILQVIPVAGKVIADCFSSLLFVIECFYVITFVNSIGQFFGMNKIGEVIVIYMFNLLGKALWMMGETLIYILSLCTSSIQQTIMNIWNSTIGPYVNILFHNLGEFISGWFCVLVTKPFGNLVGKCSAPDYKNFTTGGNHITGNHITIESISTSLTEINNICGVLSLSLIPAYTQIGMITDYIYNINNLDKIPADLYSFMSKNKNKNLADKIVKTISNFKDLFGKHILFPVSSQVTILSPEKWAQPRARQRKPDRTSNKNEPLHIEELDGGKKRFKSKKHQKYKVNTVKNKTRK